MPAAACCDAERHVLTVPEGTIRATIFRVAMLAAAISGVRRAAGGVEAVQKPFHSGARFPVKAATPSRKSALP